MQLTLSREQAADTRKKLVFILILVATIFDGITQGIPLLQETIAKKALLATDFQIAAIGIIAQTTMIFSFFISYSFSNRNKKWLICGGYIAGRLIFLVSHYIENTTVFLILLFLYYATFSIQIPILNSFYQQYFQAKRGFVFGIFRSTLILFMMITSLIVGKILDINSAFYKPVLTVIAISAAVSYSIFFWIESKTDYPPVTGERDLNLREALADILKNRDFLVYEILFMVYGFAYMFCVPAVPIFMLKTLKLSYFEMGQAQGIYAQLFVMLLSPFAGLVFDRVNLWRVGTVSFGVLILYPLMFSFSALFLSKPLAYTALLFYSLGMSGVNVLWNLGTISFARDRDSFFYQGFHVSLTGIRGFIGPLIGYFILSQFGVMTNFNISAVLFLAAAIGSLVYSYWRR